MPPPTDSELLARIPNGDRAPFEALYDRYSREAFGLAARICGPARAQEAVQDAFVSVWQDAWRYDPRRGGGSTWLLRIVSHRAIDALRKARTRDRTLAMALQLETRLSRESPTEHEVVQLDEARRVQAALDRLPLEQRGVVRMAYFDGLTHPEIARVTGAPVGTVKGRMRLGLEKLQFLLVDPSRLTANGPAGKELGRTPFRYRPRPGRADPGNW